MDIILKMYYRIYFCTCKLCMRSILLPFLLTRAVSVMKCCLSFLVMECNVAMHKQTISKKEKKDVQKLMHVMEFMESLGQVLYI